MIRQGAIQTSCRLFGVVLASGCQLGLWKVDYSWWFFTIFHQPIWKIWKKHQIGSWNPQGIRGENPKKIIATTTWSRSFFFSAGSQIPDVVNMTREKRVCLFGAQQDVTVVSFKDDNITQTTHDYPAGSSESSWNVGILDNFLPKLPGFPNDFEAKQPVFFFLFDTKVRSSIKKGMAQFGVTVWAKAMRKSTWKVLKRERPRIANLTWLVVFHPPIWKNMPVKLDHFRNFRGENNKSLKPPPRSLNKKPTTLW